LSDLGLLFDIDPPWRSCHQNKHVSRQRNSRSCDLAIQPFVEDSKSYYAYTRRPRWASQVPWKPRQPPLGVSINTNNRPLFVASL